MGLFSDLFGDLFKKPKTLMEKIAEDHPLKWYSSSGASSLLIELCTTFKEPQDRRNILFLWLSGYFGEIENIKNLGTHGVTIATGPLGEGTAALFEREAEQYETVAQKVFYGMKYIFDETTNPYIRFAQKLNHQFFGDGAKVICRLIYLGYVDVDKDEWLYDKALFAVQEDSEKGEKLSEKIVAFLRDKGLQTEEILEEIAELE